MGSIWYGACCLTWRLAPILLKLFSKRTELLILIHAHAVGNVHIGAIITRLLLIQNLHIATTMGLGLALQMQRPAALAVAVKPPLNIDSRLHQSRETSLAAELFNNFFICIETLLRYKPLLQGPLFPV